MANQTITGKAFEYALLTEFYERLKKITSVEVILNPSYKIAKNCFETFPEKDKDAYIINASAAVNFLLDVEPRLSNGIETHDILQLEIVADKKGQAGDVRDLLAIRLLQKWEIGISAKNNHKAVKHSRLSQKIDFGKKWLDIPCSKEYFEEITPIFSELATLRKMQKGILWDNLPNMHERFYIPVLNAFKRELLKIDVENPGLVPQRLTEYLIGKQDFYKVIKGKDSVEIQGYNLHGSLNQPFNSIKPKARINRLKLPTRLVEIIYGHESTTTLLVSLNEGWQISFRIHSASSRVEASL